MFKYVLYLLKKQLFKIAPIKSWRKKLKNTLPAEYQVKWYSKKELAHFCELLKKYPAIMSAEETLNCIVDKKLSFSRIGDGEFNLMIDEGNIFNKNDEKIKQRLIEICESKHQHNCLICLNNYVKTNKWFLYHGLFALPRILSTVKFQKQNFGDAYFLFYNIMEEKIRTIQLPKIKSLWNNEKILFVCNKNSLLIDDNNHLFDNVIQKHFLLINPKNAFDEYNKVLQEIYTYSKDWIIYLECGATASVLAWDLSNAGYRALDMGSFYTRLIGRMKDE